MCSTTESFFLMVGGGGYIFHAMLPPLPPSHAPSPHSVCLFLHSPPNFFPMLSCLFPPDFSDSSRVCSRRRLRKEPQRPGKLQTPMRLLFLPKNRTNQKLSCLSSFAVYPLLCCSAQIENLEVSFPENAEYRKCPSSSRHMSTVLLMATDKREDYEFCKRA